MLNAALKSTKVASPWMGYCGVAYRCSCLRMCPTTSASSSRADTFFFKVSLITWAAELKRQLPSGSIGTSLSPAGDGPLLGFGFLRVGGRLSKRNLLLLGLVFVNRHCFGSARSIPTLDSNGRSLGWPLAGGRRDQPPSVRML